LLGEATGGLEDDTVIVLVPVEVLVAVDVFGTGATGVVAGGAEAEVAGLDFGGAGGDGVAVGAWI